MTAEPGPAIRAKSGTLAYCVFVLDSRRDPGARFATDGVSHLGLVTDPGVIRRLLADLARPRSRCPASG